MTVGFTRHCMSAWQTICGYRLWERYRQISQISFSSYFCRLVNSCTRLDSSNVDQVQKTGISLGKGQPSTGFLFLLLINYNIMYNNYTDTPNQYSCCNVVVPAQPGSGALLIGDFNSATDGDQIKAHNIRTIITAAAGMEHLNVQPHILHITFPLLDSKTENIRHFFEDCNTVIKANLPKGSVLVHCAAGISRSATLIIAYLIKSRKITFKEAIGIVRAKRKNICPNLGFQRQLKQYEKEVLEGAQNRPNIKKTASEKISEEHQTVYHHSRVLNSECFKFQPKTAEHSVRKKNQGLRKPPHSYSQSRPRDKKNFMVRQVNNKEHLYILGQGQGNRQGLTLSEKITPPVIQTHSKNIYPGIGKLMMKKNY